MCVLGDKWLILLYKTNIISIFLMLLAEISHLEIGEKINRRGVIFGRVRDG